jgi:hypothetical protein
VDVEYTILFPFEADPRVEGLSFEIKILFPSPLNERRERFRTIGLDMEGMLPQANLLSMSQKRKGSCTRVYSAWR